MMMVSNISGAVGFWGERSALGSDWSYSSNSLLTSPIAAPADCSPVASSLQIHCHQKNSPQDKNGFSDLHADPWMAGHRRWTWSPNGKGEWKWQQQIMNISWLKIRKTLIILKGAFTRFSPSSKFWRPSLGLCCFTRRLGLSYWRGNSIQVLSSSVLANTRTLI